MIKNIDHTNVINYGTDSLIIKSASAGFGKPVCKKILSEEFPAAGIVAQLENEFEICSKVKCASIRKAYKKEKLEDHLVLELEYIEGKDLNKFLTTEKMDFLQQLNLAVDLVSALTDLQRENIFFRQVHPSNILIEESTHKIFFIDFGLAAHANGFETGHSPANEKQVDYLKYISPEQTGRINRAIDNRADLYSIGVILYRIFTGLLPFESNDSLELIYAHVAKEPEDPLILNKELPVVISDIIKKLLSKNAEDRYQSAFGVKADFEICLKSFMANNKIEKFDLAKFDFSGKLHISSTLYGREKEVNHLQYLFESSAEGNKSTLLISGYSGSGKSALVETLQKAVLKKKGFFLKGKFDQISSGTPYSTFVQAFNELLHMIMTGDEVNRMRWKKRITEALGHSVKILTEFIPGLEELVGKMPEMPKLRGKEAQNRFNYEFVRFLKTLADKEHPLVIFVDDFQWADASSLKLFKIIAENRDIEYVTLIGAYRKNEVDETHPLMIQMDELRSENIYFDEIDLKDLLYQDVHQLVSGALLTQQEDTTFLADLIYTKTKGNAFYIWQFLKSIYEERFLWFDFDSQRWHWNTDLIIQMNVSGNVVELMTAFVQKLPEETLELLEAASTIGNRFEKRTLSVIKQLNEKKVDSLLNISNTEGLIIPFGTEYKFAHDRVQQAIYSLIPEERKAALHLSNGKRLTAHYSHVEFQDRIFEIVNQWNMGASQLTDKTEKIYLASLNHQAGQKAMSSAAYPQALQYFEKGIDVLDNGSWKDQYELLLQITGDAADAAYLSGEYGKVDKHVTSLSQNSKSLTDSIKGYEVDIKKLIAQNKLIEAVKLGLQILQKLGIRFPLKPGKLSILKDLLRTKWLLRNKSSEYFNNLPVMEDDQKNAAMRIMSDITSAAYFAVPNLVPLLVFKMVNHTVKYGLSRKSPFSFSAYGFILSVHLKEIDKGSSYGDIAIHRLADGAEDAQARQVVVARVRARATFGGLDERSDRGRRGVEDRHLVLLDHLPEAARVGVGRDAFENDLGATERERPVGDVGMAGNPADVGGAPEHIVGLQVEGPLRRQRRVQQVAAGAVLHALGFAGGAARVQQEQRMFGAHPLGLAGVALGLHLFVQPAVARGVPGDRATGALVDDHVLHRLAAAQADGLVDDRLQRQLLAAAHLLVGADHHHRACAFDAVAQGLRREPAEDHRMRGADARAGLHRDHAFDAHRHVDDDTVALLDAACLQRVGQAAGAREQFAIVDAAYGAVIGLEDDGRLLAHAALDVAVQAVVRDVQRTVLEPLEERRIAVVEALGEGRLPADELARQARPVGAVVGLGFGHQLVVGGHSGDEGTLHRGRWWGIESCLAHADLFFGIDPTTKRPHSAPRSLLKRPRVRPWHDRPILQLILITEECFVGAPAHAGDSLRSHRSG